MASSVSEQCRSCLTALRNIDSALSKPGHESRRVSHDQIIEEVDRFSLWTGNIGALHQPDSPMSIESRLREASDVLTHILSLLDDLGEVAHELLDIVTGERDGMRALASQDQAEAGSNEDDAASSEEDEISEENELLQEISGTITRLFRVSSLIRQAAPTDLFAKALSRSRYRYNDQFDIAHVGEKYPKLAIDEYAWLRARLGRAITQRRHYLSYIQDHREKLEGTISHNMRETSAAKSQVPVNQPLQAVKPRMDSASRPSTFFTKATTIVPERITPQMLVAEESDPEDDARSYTTISRSVDGDYETSTVVRIPALDDLRNGTRKEIECPFCFRMKKFKNERTWRRHVFSDLHSYVCTFPECDAPYFGDINEWFRHEMQNHRVSYKCMLCKDKLFYHKEKYLAHVRRKHPDMLEDGEEQTVLDIARKPLEQIPAEQCPCCSEWVDRLKERGVSASLPIIGDTLAVVPTVFKRHLASHLEQLALFAIPIGATTEGEVDSNAAIEEVNSKQSDGSQPSVLTFDSSPPSQAARAAAIATNHERMEQRLPDILKDSESDVAIETEELNPRATLLAISAFRQWKRFVLHTKERRRVETEVQNSNDHLPKTELLISGYPPLSSQRFVTSLFEKYGEVLTCGVNVNPQSSFGIGYVEMATVAQAEAARHGLHGTSFAGRYISVNFIKFGQRKAATVGISFWNHFRSHGLSNFEKNFKVLITYGELDVKTNTVDISIFPLSGDSDDLSTDKATLELQTLEAAFSDGIIPYDTHVAAVDEEESQLVGWSQEFLVHLAAHGGAFEDRHSVHLRFDDGKDGVVVAFLKGLGERTGPAVDELHEWSRTFDHSCISGACEVRHSLDVPKDPPGSVLNENAVRDICKKHLVTVRIDSDTMSNHMTPGTVWFTLIGDMKHTFAAWKEIADSPTSATFVEGPARTPNPDPLLQIPEMGTSETQIRTLERKFYYSLLFGSDTPVFERLEKDYKVTITRIRRLRRTRVIVRIGGLATNVESVCYVLEKLQADFAAASSHGEYEGYGEVTGNIAGRCYEDPATPAIIHNLERRHSVKIAIFEHLNDVGMADNYKSYYVVGPEGKLVVALNELQQYESEWVDKHGNVLDLERDISDRVEFLPTIFYYYLVVENTSEQLDSIAQRYNVEFILPSNPAEVHSQTKGSDFGTVEMTIRGTETDVELAFEEFQELKASFSQQYGASPEILLPIDVLEIGLVEQWFWESKSEGRQKEFERRHRVRIHCEEEDPSQRLREQTCTIIGRKDRLENAREELFRLESEGADLDGNPLSSEILQPDDRVSLTITDEIFSILPKKSIEDIMAKHHVLIQLFQLEDFYEANIRKGTRKDRDAAAQELGILVNGIKNGEFTKNVVSEFEAESNQNKTIRRSANSYMISRTFYDSMSEGGPYGSEMSKITGKGDVLVRFTHMANQDRTIIDLDLDTPTRYSVIIDLERLLCRVANSVNNELPVQNTPLEWPFHVHALHDFSTGVQGDLTFAKGDTILVRCLAFEATQHGHPDPDPVLAHTRDVGEWYFGDLLNTSVNMTGIFPKNFVAWEQQNMKTYEVPETNPSTADRPRTRDRTRHITPKIIVDWGESARSYGRSSLSKPLAGTPTSNQFPAQAQHTQTPSPAPRPPSPPPFPEGWIAHLDPSSGQYYYIHLPTQSTQWEFPKWPTTVNLNEPMSPSYRRSSLSKPSAGTPMSNQFPAQAQHTQTPSPAPVPASPVPASPVPASPVPASPPPLPEGWIAHLDPSSGQYYYIHLPTQSTQWEFPKWPTTVNLNEPMSPSYRRSSLSKPSAGTPTSNQFPAQAQHTQTPSPAPGPPSPPPGPPSPPPGSTSPPPLPEGWIAHLDPSSGQYYYIHLPTQSTQWEFPKWPTLNLNEPMSPSYRRSSLSKPSIGSNNIAIESPGSDASDKVRTGFPGASFTPASVNRPSEFESFMATPMTITGASDNFYRGQAHGSSPWEGVFPKSFVDSNPEENGPFFPSFEKLWNKAPKKEKREENLGDDEDGDERVYEEKAKDEELEEEKPPEEEEPQYDEPGEEGPEWEGPEEEPQDDGSKKQEDKKVEEENQEDKQKPTLFPFRAVAVQDHVPLESSLKSQIPRKLSFRAGQPVRVVKQLDGNESDLYWGTVSREKTLTKVVHSGAFPVESVVHEDIWGVLEPFDDELTIRCDICPRYFRSLALRSAHYGSFHNTGSSESRKSLEKTVEEPPEPLE
jgi:hypothetical protein